MIIRDQMLVNTSSSSSVHYLTDAIFSQYNLPKVSQKEKTVSKKVIAFFTMQLSNLPLGNFLVLQNKLQEIIASNDTPHSDCVKQ